METVKGWSFGLNTGADVQNRPAAVGLTHISDGRQMIAYHDPLIALKYATHWRAWRVAVWGDLQEDVAGWTNGNNRRYLWTANNPRIFRRFALKCAIDLFQLIEPPAAVRDYLTTDNEEIRLDALLTIKELEKTTPDNQRTILYVWQNASCDRDIDAAYWSSWWYYKAVPKLHADGNYKHLSKRLAGMLAANKEQP